MELNFIRQEALDYLSKDVKNNIERYASENNVWLEDFFHEKNIKRPVFSSDIEIPEIELIGGNEASLDAENAVILYEALRGKMNAVQAADRRLWVALTHTTFYLYMKSRWPIENKLNDKGTNGTVKDRYFMSRGFFRNGVSRLYWISEMTYDENLQDPYEYTKYLFGKQDLINQIEGRSFCRNRKLLKACLKALKQIEPLKENQRRQYFELMYKRGGVIVLDILPEKELDMICSQVASEVVQAKQVENGSIILLRTVDSDKTVQFEVRNGKACVGKTVFRSKPENLYRLSIGKEIEISKTKYQIIGIE